MDQQPKIPTLKDAQKPQVKIKGMSAGVTLFDRLKQFKKKDLAFILAGLGTLFMAPLAEHFMMAPESGDAALQQGWGGGKGPGSNLFGSGSSPYENGNNNIAQGGAIGGAGDIITPLNVRDPSALVMGPGAAQQPNAGAVTPPAPPVTAPPSGGEDYKDALKGAASRAASAAVKRSPLPVPKVSLGGTNLRGLGVAGGGTSASGSLGPIGPAAGSNGANGGGGGLNLVRSNPNFRGVAGARSPTGSGLDGTKKAGANAGDAFSRTGSALSGLNAAANEQIPTGGQGYGGGGGGGAGANDKPGGGSGPGGSKSVGESLAFIEAKERMMENLKLEFEKRKLKDPELLLYGIRNDILKASGAKIGEALTKTFMCKTMITGCPESPGDYTCTGGVTPAGFTPACSGGAPAAGSTDGPGCWLNDGSGSQKYFPTGLGGGAQPTIVCNPSGKGGGSTKPGSAVSGSNAAQQGRISGALSGSAPVVGEGLDGGCAAVAALATTQLAAAPKPGEVKATAAAIDGKEIPYYKAMLNNGGKNLVTARSLLNGEGSATSCGGAPQSTADKTAVALMNDARTQLQTVGGSLNALVEKAKDGQQEVDTHQTSVASAADLVVKARSQVDTAKTLIEGSETADAKFAPYALNKTEQATAATKKLADAKAELAKNQGTIDTDLKALEAVLKKAQETVGTAKPKTVGTLTDVLAQNQAFLDMKAAVERKKTDLAKTDPAWSGAAIDDPKKVTPGGSTEPNLVAGEKDKAATAIKAVCDKIGGCDAPAAPKEGDAAPVAKPGDAAATPPKYADVSPLFKPATDGVSTMRQTQSNAISGINADLEKLGPAKQ